MQRESAKARGHFRKRERKRGFLVVLVEDRRRKIVHPVFRSAASEEDHVRQRHGSTRRRRLREADGISCSRISINQVTMRPRLAGDGKSSRTELARRRFAILVAVAGRAASRFRRDRKRAGTPRGGDLSIARSMARAFPPDFSYGGEKTDGGTGGSCVTTFHRRRFEIARRNVLSLALLFCSLSWRLRITAENKFAWTRSGARVP